MPLLHVDKLEKSFRVGKQVLQALKPTTFSIHAGETLALVGESGCGKSTLGRTLLRLYEPTGGKVFFRGCEVTALSSCALKAMRRHMQIVFQDPYSSLNPRMTVGDIIQEPLEVHQRGQSHRKRVLELLDLVNLPQSCIGRFPHEFSGGQRQRIGIARALALSPEFIVCDEPISALDVSIQAQIANLLLSLQKELNLTYLFIAHDLAMVKVLAARVAVMYLGEIVEIGPADQILLNPQHPYTQLLLASSAQSPTPIISEPPSPLKPSKGCPFSSRCPKAGPLCSQQKPSLKEIAPGHSAACLFVETKKGAWLR